MPSSKGSSQPREQTQVSSIAGRFFTVWDTREALQVIRPVEKNLTEQSKALHTVV